jgi:hypothetical protein
VSLPLGTGWNWFSLNLDDTDMSLDHVLESLGESGEYIKNQTAFAEYVTEWSSWFGTLTEISCHETYMIKMAQPDTLVFCGFPYYVNAPLDLPAGWSWISYLPWETMTVDEALSSLGASGEYIKNQTAFAEYVTEWSSWFGTLSDMQPLDGYKIKMAVSDTLVYPDPGGLMSGGGPRVAVAAGTGPEPGTWAVQPHAFETNGCLIAEVRLRGKPCVEAGDCLGAFVGSECRGVVSPLVSLKGIRLFYLTVYGSGREEEILSFKYRSLSDGITYTIDEEVAFSPDMVLGSSGLPFVLNTRPRHGMGEDGPVSLRSLSNRPDPFRKSTTISLRVSSPGHMSVGIYSIRGEKVATLLEGYQEAQTHTFVWDGTADSGREVPGGVYFCRVVVDGGIITEKLVLMK